MVTACLPTRATSPADAFVQMLPQLRRRLRPVFASFTPERREDALQEALANCFAALARLWERNRHHLAAPAALVKYAVAQWFDGRRVGTSSNRKDVLSPYARRRHGRQIVELIEGDFVVRNAAQADGRSPVPDQAAFRIDFPGWLGQLSDRNRRIAVALAHGETTSDVAQRFELSCARESQMRRQLCQSWADFHDGEDCSLRAA